MRRSILGLLLVLLAVAVIPLFVPGPQRMVAPRAPAGPAPTAFGWIARLGLIAGDGTAALQDGPVAQARFVDPYGIAMDGGGRIYVSDGGSSNRIRVVAPNGQVSTLAGANEGFADGSSSAASFNTPSAIALDPQGNLIVADTGNHAIRKVSPLGVVTTIAGTGTPGFQDGPARQAQFNGPIGVAVDARGRIFVADSYNDRIRMIGVDGIVSTLAGGDRPGNEDGHGTDARFDTPCALALDGAGNLWIADTHNDAIRKLTPSGDVTTFPAVAIDAVPADLRRPLSIAVTHDGFLYVGEMAGGRVLQYSPAGEMAVLTGAEGSADRLFRPAGIAVDAAGAVYVTDAQSARIHKIVPRVGAMGGTIALSAQPAASPAGAEKSASAMSAASPSDAKTAVSEPDRAIAAVPPALPAAKPTTIAAVTRQSQTELSDPSGPAIDAPLPQTGGRWPVKPQSAWHEIAGTLGEVRGNDQGESRDHLHAGLDIHAEVGAEVLAMADAKVSDPLSTWHFGDLSEGFALDTLDYIHMRVGRTLHNKAIDAARFTLLTGEDGQPARVRVRRGTRFKVGDVLGTVNAMTHVHLSLDGNDAQRNAIALNFVELSDHVAPTIDSVQLLDSAAKVLTKKRKGRLLVPRDADGLQIVVDAWDHVDNNLARRRLGLYALGYQILKGDGTPLPEFESPRITIEFKRMPLDDDAVKIVYAEHSGETVHGSSATHFRYAVTNVVRDGRAEIGRWQTAALAPGDYTLRIIARDYAGNQARRGSEIALTIE